MKGHLKIKRQIEDSRIAEIVKLRIQGMGFEAIAERIGISRSQVHRLWTTDVAKLTMEKTRKEIAGVAEQVASKASDDVAKSIEERLQSAGSAALTVMRELIDHENPFVQVKAASDLMDRDTRMSKTKNTKLQGSVVHALVTAEQLVLAAHTARELKALGGHTVQALPITAEIMGLEEADGA